jgi:hypothetical protein
VVRPPVLPLLAKADCPNCWGNFDPADVLWISVHQDLRDDPRLGSEEQVRFLPTIFTPDGEALDLRGMVCRQMACPHCHLPLPRPTIELDPLFVSILGTPSCGKSYYLAATSWTLRQLLPQYFAISFGDADPTVNLTLTETERQLFLHAKNTQLVPLADLVRKTALAGELYHTVYEGEHAIRYLKPFAFTVRPRENHPNYSKSAELARMLVLYDNAGEHFMPGREEANAPVTMHLAKSQLLLYLFDPTQDPRFRKLYEKNNPVAAAMNLRSERQDVVLREAAARVRRFTGMTSTSKHGRPLVVIVTKCDIWGDLLNDDTTQEPWLLKDGLAGLDRDRILKRSQSLKTLLEMTCPEVIAAAEEFSNQVVYMPVSALGRSPTLIKVKDKEGKPVDAPAIRPVDIAPRGVIVPLLYALNLALPGLVMNVKRPSQPPQAGTGNHRPAAGQAQRVSGGKKK